MNLTEIQAAIDEWNAKRQNGSVGEIVEILNQGFCFEVTNANYQSWLTNNPDYIHSYLGIVNNELTFFLIDSTADKAADFTNIIVKAYTNGVDGTGGTNTTYPPIEESITQLEALQRSYKWNMYGTAYINDVKGTEAGIFQVMCIPFANYEAIFTANSLANAVNFFGIRQEEGEDDSIEIIVCQKGDAYDLPLLPSNRSVPIPPFKPGLQPTDFQLLITST